MKKSLNQLKRNADSVLNKQELKSIGGGGPCEPGLDPSYRGVEATCLDYNNSSMGTVCIAYYIYNDSAEAVCADESRMVSACEGVYGYQNVNHAICYY